jgi:SlyX protein
MSEQTFEERIADLEIKLDQATDMVDELNRSLYRQQTQIDQLAQVLVGLSDRIDANAPREFKSLLDDIPPHY